MKKNPKILLLLVLVCLITSLLVACGKTSYKVEFVVDGVVYHTEHISGNDVIPFPKNQPTKTGHIFMGWYADDGVWEDAVVSTRFFDKAIDKDLKVYARFIEDIPDHSHSYDKLVVPATCETKGYTTYLCVCGLSYRGDEVAALGHDFTHYESNQDATLEADGTKTATCNRDGCNEKDTVADVGSMLVHNYGAYTYNNDATCGKEGTATAECDHCDMTHTKTVAGTALSHVFTDYVPDNNATYYSDGTKSAYCDHGCGTKDTIRDVGSMLPSTIKFDGLTLIGDNEYSLTQRNATDEIDFNDYIKVTGKVTYTVGNDKYGTVTYPNKLAPIVVGDNTFYIFADVNGENNTYVIKVHRNKTYSIRYDLPMGTTHENPATYEEGSTLQLSAPIDSDGDIGVWLDEEGNEVTSLPIGGEYRDVSLTALTKTSKDVYIGVTNAGYGIKWLEKTIDEFNAMQDEYKVTINEESPNYDSKGEQQLKYPATAKNDIYIISEIWWKTNAKNNYYKSLDEVYAAPFNEDMTIEEAMRDENRVDAKVVDRNGDEHYYAINYTSTAAGLVYNKTIGDYYESLPQWGTTPKMATIKNGGTVDQLVQWMEKVEELSKTYYDFTGTGNGKYLDGVTAINTENGTKPAVYPLVYAGTHSYWDAVINTWWAQAAGINGYRQFFEYSSPAVYADTARLRALKALEKLEVNKNSVPGSVQMNHIDSQNEFLRGRAAIIPCGDWMYYESKQNADAWGTDFEMIYVPACDDAVPNSQRNYVHYTDGGLCVIPNNDKVNYEGAKAFLKYLFSEKGCQNFTKETGSMWGFDGTEDPNTNYATELVLEGMLSPFNEKVIDLVNLANAKVTDLPLNLNAPNAKFRTTSGVAGPWPSADLSKIRDGSRTAQQIFDNIIAYVGQETPNHNSDSEWDRWWKIVDAVNG